MLLFLSILPILSTILALLLRVRAVYAAWVGIVAAVVSILLAFPLSVGQVHQIMVQWVPMLCEVLLIIAGGVFLSKILQESGAQAALAKWVEERTPQGISAVLLVVHGIIPFAESVTGFGIGITIGIPLLLHLRFSAGVAALLGLFGLCAVPWGSMGPGTLIAAKMGNVPFYELGVVSAVISAVPFMVTGAFAGWVSSAAEHRFRHVLCGLGSGALLTLAVTGSNILCGTAAAGALGALGMIVFYFFLGRGRVAASLNMVARRALCSYAVLLIGVLAAGLVLQFLHLPAGWHYLASPALWLFLAAGYYVRGLPNKDVVGRTYQAWCHIAPVTGLFIVLGVLMSVSGMASYLARICAGVGPFYAILAPFVAGLGGFITGSNSGANAMFAATQADIARSLSIDPLWLEGIHNVASAFFLMASPGKIEMALQLVPKEAAKRKLWLQKVTLIAGMTVLIILAVAEYVYFFVG